MSNKAPTPIFEKIKQILDTKDKHIDLLEQKINMMARKIELLEELNKGLTEQLELERQIQEVK